MTARICDLGCGPNKTPGAYGVDAEPYPGVDLVHDLEDRPWPIEDARFDRVVARHVVEHLEDIPAFFKEVHRICADGAAVSVVTPHYSNRCAYLDPTHRHALSARFVEFIAEGKPWKPSGRCAVARSYLLEHHHDYAPLVKAGAFSLESRHVSFARIYRWLGIEALANRKIDFYEFYLAWIFPARDIFIEMRVHKNEAPRA